MNGQGETQRRIDGEIIHRVKLAANPTQCKLIKQNKQNSVLSERKKKD